MTLGRGPDLVPWLKAGSKLTWYTLETFGPKTGPAEALSLESLLRRNSGFERLSNYSAVVVRIGQKGTFLTGRI